MIYFLGLTFINFGLISLIWKGETGILRQRQTQRDLLSAGSLSKMLWWSVLSDFETKSTDLHLGIPTGSRGPSTGLILELGHKHSTKDLNRNCSWWFKPEFQSSLRHFYLTSCCYSDTHTHHTHTHRFCFRFYHSVKHQPTAICF